MIFAKLDNWKEGFRHDGLLYFTHRIAEMLFHYTDHIYKVPVYNTQLLVQEYLDTFMLVINGTIDEAHLETILEEFEFSFEHDVVLKKHLDKDLQKRILHKIHSSDKFEREKVFDFLDQKLVDYNDWCFERIKEIVNEEKEKKEIEQTLRCFIPSLIGSGYSHEYVYHLNKKIFSNHEVSSFSSLDDFLRSFDFAEHSFTVFIPLNKRVKLVKETLIKSIPNLHFVKKEDAPDFLYDKDQFVLAKIEIQSLDCRMAVKETHDSLNVFFRFYNFLGENVQNVFGEKAKVVDEHGNIDFAEVKTDCYSIPSSFDVKEASELAEMLLSALSEIEWRSKETLMRALDLHNTAIRSKNLKSGFLDFWSILEIILVADEPNVNTIKEIESKLLPILLQDYVNRVFVDLEKNLNQNLPEPVIEEMKRKVGDDGQWLKKLVLFAEFESVRKSFSDEALKDFPLIRSRIYALNSMLHDKCSMKKELRRIEQRIKWHLTRLYRTRNAIIHSGEHPEFLKELGEHLHCYADICLKNIILQLVDFKSIDAAIIDVQLKMEFIWSMLEKNSDFVDADLKLLFHS